MEKLELNLKEHFIEEKNKIYNIFVEHINSKYPKITFIKNISRDKDHLLNIKYKHNNYYEDIQFYFIGVDLKYDIQQSYDKTIINSFEKLDKLIDKLISNVDKKKASHKIIDYYKYLKRCERDIIRAEKEHGKEKFIEERQKLEPLLKEYKEKINV